MSPAHSQTSVVLQCPKCSCRLATPLACDGCGSKFSTVNGIPVLIDHERSVFSHEDIESMANVVENFPGRIHRFRGRLVPKLSSNLTAQKLYDELRSYLLDLPHPTVLCIGNGEGGKGFDFLRHPKIHIVSTDVAITPETDYAVDAHSLPFADGSFDAVIAQAVLEHVVDPGLCVSEIHRVLRPDGIVFAETPFMQQVHLGRYDFTRFTHLGHRRLFRMFTEISSGQVAAAGTALAWSLAHFFDSLPTTPSVRRFMRLAIRFSFFWLKYLDPWISRTPASWDSASCFYFLGRRCEQPLEDRALIAGYRGKETEGFDGHVPDLLMKPERNGETTTGDVSADGHAGTLHA